MRHLSKKMKAAAFVSALALMASLSSVPNTAHAQEISEARIAVIDVARVERESVAWQSLRDQFENLVSSYQEELRERQSALEAEGRELEQQRSILSQEAFQQKKQDFDRQVAELQRAAQQRKQDMDKAYASARNQIRGALRDVVLEIAKNRDLNLIFSNSTQERTVVMAHDDLSISEEALEMLNEKIKSVELPNPTSE